MSAIKDLGIVDNVLYPFFHLIYIVFFILNVYVTGIIILRMSSKNDENNIFLKYNIYECNFPIFLEIMTTYCYFSIFCMTIVCIYSIFTIKKIFSLLIFIFLLILIIFHLIGLLVVLSYIVENSRIEYEKNNKST